VIISSTLQILTTLIHKRLMCRRRIFLFEVWQLAKQGENDAHHQPR